MTQSLGPPPYILNHTTTRWGEMEFHGKPLLVGDRCGTLVVMKAVEGLNFYLVVRLMESGRLIWRELEKKHVDAMVRMPDGSFVIDLGDVGVTHTDRK